MHVLEFGNFWIHQNFNPNYQICMSKTTSHKTLLLNTSNISYQQCLYLKRQLFQKFCSNTCERHAETIRNCPLNWSGNVVEAYSNKYFISFFMNQNIDNKHTKKRRKINALDWIACFNHKIIRTLHFLGAENF